MDNLSDFFFIFQLQVDSLTREGAHYSVQLQDEKIVACNCPAFSQSRLTCKHMFLAIRVTNYAILLPHAIIPNHRDRDPEGEGLEEQRAHKRRLVEKIRDGISSLEEASYWVRADDNGKVDLISKASLTRLLSAVDDLKHLARDTLLVRSDNVTQW